MADTDIDIIVKMQDEASKRLKELNKNLQDTGKRASRTARLLGGLRSGLNRVKSQVLSLKGAIAGIGLGLLARSFITAASEAEQLQVRLRVILGSVAEANRLFEDVARFASGVAFEFGDISSAATQLAGVMEGGVDEVNRWLPLIADLAATSGLGIQDTTSQIIRMYSAGAASADLFRERGILAMLGFQAGVSVSAEETRKRLVAAWEDPASRFRGASELLSTTWTGMLSMMADAWLQFRQMVMDEGLFDFIKAAVSLVVDEIGRMREAGTLDDFAKRMADVVINALTRMAQAIAIVADAWRGWQLIWQGLRGGFALFAEGINRILEQIGKFADFIFSTIGIGFEKLGRLATIIDIGPVNAELGVTLTTVGKIVGELDNASAMGKENAEYWADIVKESADALNNLNAQPSALSRVNALLGRIRDRAAEFAEAQKDAGEARPQVQLTPEISNITRIEAVLQRLRASTTTVLEEIKVEYDKNLISVGDYYDQRVALAEASFAREEAALQELLGAETNVDKQEKLKVKLFQLEEKFTQDLLKLGEERRKAEEQAAKDQISVADSLAQLRERAAFDSATNISNIFRQQQLELKTRQAQEIQELKDHNATKAELEEAYRLQQLEREKQFADQRRQIQELVLNNISESLGFMEQAFGDAYEASGKKAKAFFYAQKAVSIAQTVISTYEAAQKAYSSLAGIPYVGPALGAAAAAIAIAAGLARVAAIRSQSLAEGGEVLGSSPHSKADNIKINATAGEFMHPVKTVKHYGRAAMTAIKDRLVPREVLQAYAAPVPTRSFGYAYQAGGPVGDRSAPEGATPGSAPNVNVVNVIDPQMMDQYVTTTHGQRNILNVISNNAFAVKTILQAE